MTAPVQVTAPATRVVEPAPVPTARVNLLPPEIFTARMVRRVQRRTLLALIAVVLACVAGNVYFRLDADSAATALESERGGADVLRAQQTEFVELPRVLAAAGSIDTALATVMADDVTWSKVVVALNANPNADIVLTGITATVADVGVTSADGSATAGAGPSALDTTGAGHLGVLLVSGNAPNHEAVAAWVEYLGGVEGFLVPYIRGSQVGEEAGAPVEFTVEITLGTELRSLRYAAPSPGIDGTATDGTATDGTPTDGTSTDREVG